jgi:hypothetical protein
MDICWIKGTANKADVFTKNLDGPAFVECIKTLVGQDVYMKSSTTSEQGWCWEVCVCFWPPVTDGLLYCMRYQSLVPNLLTSLPYPRACVGRYSMVLRRVSRI